MKNTIILQDAKFLWAPAEIAEYQELEAKGYTAREIAEIMDEEVVDVILLGLHIYTENKQKSRRKSNGKKSDKSKLIRIGRGRAAREA